MEAQVIPATLLLNVLGMATELACLKTQMHDKFVDVYDVLQDSMDFEAAASFRSAMRDFQQLDALIEDIRLS